MNYSHVQITAIGSYVPKHRLTNNDLEKMVETTDEWIVQRTGIKERRIAGEREFASDLAVAAVHDMKQRYHVELKDVDYILVATSTPDTVFPSVASQLQYRLGIEQCGALDLQAACAGFVSAIQVAQGLLLTGSKKILIVATETLSKITDYHDRTTCILFGDGAGAMLLEAKSHEKDDSLDTAQFQVGSDLIAMHAHTDGEGGHLLYKTDLATHLHGNYELANQGKLVQNGREVYRWAVTKVAKGIEQLLDKAGMQAADIDWFVPHNANQRIIDSLADKLGFTSGQALSSIAHYGNTSAASIPLALDDAVREGRVAKGQTLLLYGFGGGLTQAGVIIRWQL